jgi:hypothetical protein
MTSRKRIGGRAVTMVCVSAALVVAAVFLFGCGSGQETSTQAESSQTSQHMDQGEHMSHGDQTDSGEHMNADGHMATGDDMGSGEHMDSDDHSGMGDQSGATEPSGEGVVYTCPMHPEVRSDEPGKCPECGMYLVEAGDDEAAADAMENAVVYTCPMHPEVESHVPGQCPECGMDLRRR